MNTIPKLAAVLICTFPIFAHASDGAEALERFHERTRAMFARQLEDTQQQPAQQQDVSKQEVSKQEVSKQEVSKQEVSKQETEKKQAPGINPFNDRLPSH
ncbi:hypothetical protein HX787_21485 [Pseudomonas tolaasii]|uniref:DUF4148 domain-containing protein n=1 Tax=Pseudomonas tolaasii TaxID=29442 RepID=A0A7Y8AQG8_PSETO|nr:hypothetical protein [Pseudomonas tolaasii]MBY8944058.1 hypothetical protein [Pseudomonas tolaasii]NWC22373.1 hypothetical protein [Pseudomonas tolaasii]NWD38438.1 hypothetical protein [Pseudomonas tolaasii]